MKPKRPKRLWTRRCLTCKKAIGGRGGRPNISGLCNHCSQVRWQKIADEKRKVLLKS